MILKTLVSPLFFILMVLFVCELYLLFKSKKDTHFVSKIIVGAAFLILWFCSTNIGANLLAQPLESPFKDAKPNNVDAFIVLSCGYKIDSFGHAYLDAISMARVYYGAKAFQKSHARLLIMTGRLPNGKEYQMTKLMKKFAMDLGVSKTLIIMEPNARNTTEHPVEVRKLNLIRKNDVIGIVTSAWHLPRAMGEFRRYFPNVIPVPADSLVDYQPKGLENVMPSANSLTRSTLALNEYVGQGWYFIRHLGRQEQQ